MADRDIVIKPVGVVRSKQKSLVWGAGAGRESWRSRAWREKLSLDEVTRIEIDPALDGILDGTEEFSHLLVLWWADRNASRCPQHMKVHPMGRPDLPEVGIFATRSPMRPNPLLVTVVKLVARDGNVLEVTGLDAVDGTPVIDVKPMTPSDCPSADVRVADWLERALRELAQAREEADGAQAAETDRERSQPTRSI